jgi:DNA-binding GntR family transcriptional regulator
VNGVAGAVEQSGGQRDGAAQSRVRDALRGEILRGELTPGQRLVEADLAEAYRATRGSVRSALIDLAAEGLVERVQNRSARVRVVTLGEAIEITECRMVLEGLCAAKAAERVSPAEADELTGITVAMREAVDTGDVLAYSDLNERLHRRIRQISGQQTAAQTIERLRGQIVRHQFRLALRPGRPSVSVVEHTRIVAAITAGDAPAADRAMRAHLSSVIDALKAADAANTPAE